MRTEDIFLNDDANYNPLTENNISFSGSIPRESSHQHPLEPSSALSFELACPDGYNADIFHALPLEMQIEIIEQRNELSQQQQQQQAAPQQATITRNDEPVIPRRPLLTSDNSTARPIISLCMACCGCFVSYPKSFCIAFLTGLRKEPHIKLLLYTLLMLGPLIATFYVYRKIINGTADDDGNGFLPVGVLLEIIFCPAIFMVFYIGYLQKSFDCETYKLVSNKSSWVELNDFIRRVKAVKPILYEHAHCFSLRLVTGSSNNNGVITYYSSLQRYPTHSVNRNFPFQSWADISNLPSIDQNYGLARVYSTCNYQFGNNLTKQQFTQFKTAFHAEHASCDSMREFSTHLSFLPAGLENNFIAYEDRSFVPCCVEYKFMYILVTILGGSWVYAVWLSGFIKRYDLVFTKRLTC